MKKRKITTRKEQCEQNEWMEEKSKEWWTKKEGLVIEERELSPMSPVGTQIGKKEKSRNYQQEKPINLPPIEEKNNNVIMETNRKTHMEMRTNSSPNLRTGGERISISNIIGKLKKYKLGSKSDPALPTFNLKQIQQEAIEQKQQQQEE